MKRVALQKASEHLELAKAAVEQMAIATDFKNYEQGWTQFLAQSGRLYSKLEQGAKGCKASEPWFGNKKHERKKDPLLAYIHHARDSEEHSIDHTTSVSADALMGKVGDGDFKISFDYMVDQNGRQHFRNIKAKGADGEDLPCALANPKLVTLTVHDRRFGDKFEPPVMHRTRPIVDTSPVGIARIAIGYLEELLDEAGKLPLRF